jgi:hypothetical protein
MAASALASASAALDIPITLICGYDGSAKVIPRDPERILLPFLQVCISAHGFSTTPGVSIAY